MHPRWIELIRVADESWRSHSASRTSSGPEPWSKWYLRNSLVHGNWRDVKRLSQEAGEPIGTFVASRHLGETVPIPRNSCLRMILNSSADKKSYVSECEDEKILALHTWQIAKTDEEKSTAQERFMRLYSLAMLDQQLGRLNFLNDLRWDVDRDLPEAPCTLEYLLTLKELEPYQKKVSSLMSNKDLAF